MVGNVTAINAVRAATSTICLRHWRRPGQKRARGESQPAGGKSHWRAFFGGSPLNTKQLELLRDLISRAKVFAVVGDANYPEFDAGLPAVEAASRALGRQIVVVKTSSEHEFDGAFAKIVQAGAGALLVSGSPFFTAQRRLLVALAARQQKRSDGGVCGRSGAPSGKRHRHPATFAAKAADRSK